MPLDLKGFDLIEHSILMQELAHLEVHPVFLSCQSLHEGGSRFAIKGNHASHPESRIERVCERQLPTNVIEDSWCYRKFWASGGFVV